MKIDRLMTLSQFVDYVKENKHQISEDLRNKNIRITRSNIYGWLLCFFYKYNEFLKQSLKKEMFVNEIEKPKVFTELGILEQNIKEFVNIDSECEAWEEAEKKVIFEGLKYISNILYWTKNNKESKVLGGHFAKIEDIHMTLETLAEKTEGQLELKNVEI